MPSHFIDNFTHPLTTPSPSLPFATLKISEGDSAGQNKQASTTKQDLHVLLSSFPQSQLLTGPQLRNAVNVLAQLEARQKELTTKHSDTEEEALRNAVIGRVAVGLYAEAMDIYLTQATEVETEADWWKDIERSSLNVAWYLLQSMLGPRPFFKYLLIPGPISFQQLQLGCTTRSKP